MAAATSLISSQRLASPHSDFSASFDKHKPRLLLCEEGPCTYGNIPESVCVGDVITCLDTFFDLDCYIIAALHSGADVEPRDPD